MPGFDQRGPMGFGPRTGRGMGPCGRGLGFRRGFRRGFGWDMYGFSKEDEKKFLEDSLKEVEEEKKELEKRIKELKEKK